MTRWLIFVMAVLCAPSRVVAGPNAGGVLIGGADGDGGQLELRLGDFRAYPQRIHANAGRWTFLVAGTPPSLIRSVSLHIGSAVIRSSSHVGTSDSTSLWDFHYPAIGEGSATFLWIDVSGRPGKQQALRVFSDSLPPDSALTRGRLSVQLAPKVIEWQVVTDVQDPAYYIRARDQITCTVPAFCELLAALDIVRVLRPSFASADGDSTWQLPRGGVARVHPGMRSRYSLFIADTHSPQALAEILQLSPLVLQTFWAGRVVSRGGPGDTWTSDPSYPGR